MAEPEELSGLVDDDGGAEIVGCRVVLHGAPTVMIVDLELDVVATVDELTHLLDVTERAWDTVSLDGRDPCSFIFEALGQAPSGEAIVEVHQLLFVDPAQIPNFGEGDRVTVAALACRTSKPLRLSHCDITDVDAGPDRMVVVAPSLWLFDHTSGADSGTWVTWSARILLCALHDLRSLQASLHELGDNAPPTPKRRRSTRARRRGLDAQRRQLDRCANTLAAIEAVLDGTRLFPEASFDRALAQLHTSAADKMGVASSARTVRHMLDLVGRANTLFRLAAFVEARGRRPRRGSLLGQG